MGKGNTLLVVIDMQNDFITGALANYRAEEVKKNVIKKIKDAEGIVIATMDTHTKDYLTTLEGKKLPVEHCIKDTNGWKIDDDVNEALNEVDRKAGAGFKKVYVIEKPTFGSYALVGKAREFEFDDIEVCGLVSSICVITNALMLRAAFPDKPIKVDAAATAGLNDEDGDAALQIMKDCQIDII